MHRRADAGSLRAHGRGDSRIERARGARAELTPTMKLRRRPIAERYAAEIEAMYV